MGRPEPFDVRNNLAPHVPLFMSVRSFLFCQPTSRTVASRHIGEIDERFRKNNPTTDHTLPLGVKASGLVTSAICKAENANEQVVELKSFPTYEPIYEAIGDFRELHEEDIHLYIIDH